jgi:hypothetical protein
MSEVIAENAPQRIDIKEAIRKAKAMLADLMEGESYSQLGLEEVKYDDHHDQWVVTLGINRSWDVEKESSGGISASIYGVPTTISRQRRTYKKLLLDGKTGALVEMKD